MENKKRKARHSTRYFEPLTLEDVIEIAELEKESEKLQFNEDYIEKIAREKLKMVRPGEKVFKIE